jgi:sec-independent protein translocase protein TatA
LVVALLVLGPKRLPEAGRALGKGIRDFRSAMTGEDDHSGSIPAATTAQAPAPPPAVVHTPPAVVHTPPSVVHTPPDAEYAAAAPVEPASQPTEQPSEATHPVG